ncbi:response regulator [Arenibacter echinorum]|uniref:LuxR family two component transcriptional regulator n=1 Tax=Arenibacter echinorum TaxID=440515 RepID=A0A327RBP5_9FLAO|nr:response regulator transcription factor [Arenibacter echinorum]RAJ11337.1 LuxR family two component transcriptional regulator [Arenibacter echinorum]
MATRIFIVDDHYMIIEGIRSLLQNGKGLEWIGHAMSATSCMAFLQTHQPHIILLDINLPDISGIELCKEIKTKYPKIGIIGLSSYNQQSYINKIMDNGASGYVLKNATKEELLDAIETVMDGEKYLSEEAALIVKKNVGSKIPIITRREKEVLSLISEGLTNNQIATKLFISITTVDTHRKNLLAKFEAKNTATLIRMATHLEFI